MMSNSKIVERKKDMKQVKDSEDLKSASQKNPSAVTEIDLSFNQIEYNFHLIPLAMLWVWKCSPTLRF